MNFLPSAVAIVFVDSMSSQCKTRRRVAAGVGKRSVSTVSRPWRVSRAFTPWSSNFGLSGGDAAGNLMAMRADSETGFGKLKLIRPQKYALKAQ